MRIDGRDLDALRPVKLTVGFNRFAEGSVLIEMGNTMVLCNASVEERVPPHVTSGGWITAAGYIAMIIGTAGGGKIADKIGRKKLFLIGTIGTAIFGLCLAFWANSSNILVLMLLYGVCYGMPTGIHATFIGECFPTHLRSTGVGFTFNIGRLGAFIAPILMGKLVDMNMISVAIATVTRSASTTRPMSRRSSRTDPRNTSFSLLSFTQSKGGAP